MDAKSEVRKTPGSRPPAFHAELCARFGVPPIDLDGEHDAPSHAFDRAGRQPRDTPSWPGTESLLWQHIVFPDWVSPTCTTTYKPPHCGPGWAAPTCSSTAAAANYSSTSARSRRHSGGESAFPNAFTPRGPRPRGRWLIDTIPASRPRRSPSLRRGLRSTRQRHVAHRLATPASVIGCAPPLRHRCSR